MDTLSPNKCRVIWTRSDGEELVVSQHCSRDAAELVMNLIRSACESTHVRIEPKLPPKTVHSNRRDGRGGSHTAQQEGDVGTEANRR